MSKIFDLIAKENTRQIQGLEMIPSENYVSENVLKALGSILTNKYSEGYPNARYYGGNEFIDEIENYTIDLAKQIFQVEHAIVQPYSGSPANLAVDLALVEPGQVIMGLSLPMGGHLTHGAGPSYTGKLFKSIQYDVDSTGRIDLTQVRDLALEHKPKIIWVGGTAYPYIYDWSSFTGIADQIGAYLVADISHIAGLVIGGVHPSPEPYVDIITTTTHKTLRGPRGAMILITKKGLKKDPELSTKLEKSVFPGLQGGPHNHQTASIAIALEEASTPEFQSYTSQIIKNAKVLAENLDTETENHLLLINLSKYGYGLGYQAQIALEATGITVNKNTVPNETVSAYYPSGIRLGTPALTTRGMKEPEMVKIAEWIKLVLNECRGHDLPLEQSERKEFIKNFRKTIKTNQVILEIASQVKIFAQKFPTTI